MYIIKIFKKNLIYIFFNCNNILCIFEIFLYGVCCLCVIFVWEIIVGFVFWSFVWIGSGWSVVVLLFDLSFFFIGGVVGFLWWLEILILMYKVIIGINCIIKK